MNKHTRFIFSVTLIMSTLSAHALHRPKMPALLSKGTLTKGAYSSIVGATGLYYLSKKQLSEKELAQLKPILEEDSYVTMFKRIIKEVLVGQQGKRKELESIDKSGKAVYKKTPATGVVGSIDRWTKKLVLPVATCGIAFEKAKTTLKDGIIWYNNDLDKWLK